MMQKKFSLQQTELMIQSTLKKALYVLILVLDLHFVYADFRNQFDDLNAPSQTEVYTNLMGAYLDVEQMRKEANKDIEFRC